MCINEIAVAAGKITFDTYIRGHRMSHILREPETVEKAKKYLAPLLFVLGHPSIQSYYVLEELSSWRRQNV